MPKFSPLMNERFVDTCKDEYYIEILDGPFEGLCFNFKKLEFLGEDTEGNGRLAFEYDLIFVPKGITLHDNMKALEAELGVVLNVVLQNYVLENPEVESDDEARDTDLI